MTSTLYAVDARSGEDSTVTAVDCILCTPYKVLRIIISYFDLSLPRFILADLIESSAGRNALSLSNQAMTPA